MSDVFYLRPLDPPATARQVIDLAGEAGGCFNLYRVEWQSSYLASDGARMMCWYRAPDAESARMALRQLGSDMNAVWPGTVLEGAQGSPTVLVESVFEEGSSERDVIAAEQAAAEGFAAHGVVFIRAFLSSDRRRLVTVYAASDVDSVRAARAEAGMATDRAWSCAAVYPT